MLNHELPGGKRPSRRARRATWADVALPTCLMLVVSIPALLVEEDWHGRPMIDQGTHLWIVPAFLVAVAFILGGALAGFRCPATAVPHAVAAAGVAVAILLLGAVSRRVWVAHTGTQHAVVALWCLGVLVAITLSVLGSVFGRRLAPSVD